MLVPEVGPYLKHWAVCMDTSPFRQSLQNNREIACKAAETAVMQKELLVCVVIIIHSMRPIACKTHALM